MLNEDNEERFLEDDAARAEKKLAQIDQLKNTLRDRLLVGVTMYNGAVKHITDERAEYCADEISEAIDEIFHEETVTLNAIIRAYDNFDAARFRRDNGTL